MLVSSATTAAARQAAEFGSIEGRVVNVHGDGLAGVLVEAYPEGAVAGMLPTATSGTDGRFVLTSVWPGRVMLATAKEEDGYPNTDWAAVADPRSDAPWIAVFAGVTTREIVIHLGPSTGVLRGTVVDDRGMPIITARLLLYPEDQPDATISTTAREGATFLFALPDRFYTLKVTAPGFSDWSSEDAEDVPTHHLRLDADERRQLVVRLAPRMDR